MDSITREQVNHHFSHAIDSEQPQCRRERLARWIWLYERFESCKVLVHRQKVVVDGCIKNLQFLIHMGRIHRCFKPNFAVLKVVLEIADHQAVIESGNETQ